MKHIVIFGTGGFAREVHQLVEDLIAAGQKFEFVGFLDGDESKFGTSVHGYPVLGNIEWLQSQPKDSVQVVVGVGNTVSRRRIVEQLDACSTTYATLVHPRAWVGNRVEIGPGSIVCAGTLITTDIVLGRHVIVNIGSTIGHDCQIHDFVTIAPTVNVSGNVTLGEGCDIGTGSTIIQGHAIGDWSVVGAGAVVVSALPNDVTAVGIPAKVIKQRERGWHLER